MRSVYRRLSYFWISLFFHLLFVSLFFIYANPQTQKEIPYIYVPDYVPSYVDSKPIKPSLRQMNQAEEKQKSKNGLLSPDSEVFDAGLPTLAQKLSQKELPQDAIHLIGNKLEDDPLRNLLGRAITAHLSYPKLAQELRLRGVVTVGLTLFPDGQVVNVKMLKSSRENILDVAALTAINAISPVSDVNLYLKQEKYLVVNIIF